MKSLAKSKNNSGKKENSSNSGTSSTSKMGGIDSNKDKRENSSNSSKNNQNVNKDPNVPDRSYGDYYCIICDSHMNSDAMWEAHVTGKRHIKNVKKGDTDSKYEDLEGVESNIKYELRNVKDPIIGLSYIHEIRRREPNIPPMYNCFLCHASIATVPLVIEHVISLKHRLNYMKENSPDEYQLLGATNLKKGHMEPLVHEAAIKMEMKDGRGAVKVKQEKPKSQITTYKRRFDSDDDDDDRHKKLPRSTKSNKSSSVWKSVDTVKKNAMRSERSRSPRDFKDRKGRSYSDDERSMDGYKRSAPKKDSSPKREDYHRYSRQSDRNDFLRKPEYDSYSRQSDPRDRPTYNFSAEYERPVSYSKDPVKKDVYPNRNPFDDYHPQPQAHSYQPQDNLLPHEKLAEKPQTMLDPSIFLKDFVQKVFALPSDIFLKIVLSKMESMEIKGIDELSLLSKVINKAQVVLCNKLPPDVQAVLKQKMSQNSEINPQKNISGVAEPAMMPLPAESSIPSTGLNIQSCGPNIPSVRPNTETTFKPSNPQDVQSNISFIRDILNSVKSVNSTSAISQNAPTSQNVNQYQNVNSYQNPAVNTYESQNRNSYSQNANSSFQNAQYSNSNTQYPNTSGTVPNYSYRSSSSSIPGLTLTEQTTPEPHTYSNYQQYSSSPAVNQNYSYRY